MTYKNGVLKVILIAILIILHGCRLFVTEEMPEKIYEIDIHEDVEIDIPAYYKGKSDRTFTLIHTRLDLRPDWDNLTLEGSARLTVSPHFYPQDTLVVDAKGFQINEVNFETALETKPLEYRYDKLKLHIALPERSTADDTFEVSIRYIAQPYKKEAWPDNREHRDNGLFFINPKGEDINRPRQMWTQGQPNASSSWFPTLDAPNQKSTQEIFITVDNELKTISNGTLIFSSFNPDGTRTDLYEQTKPHSPYLFMVAVGDFAIVEDSWQHLDVHYYVEHAYREYAKEIFGKTPEMLQFYSDKTGIFYPWDKYHQVVVRDFRAGAMENTSAVIYFEGVQRTFRELIDEDYEKFIAHELAHHWFGNLVSTQSWAEAFINEGPATYWAYLWTEHAYSERDAEKYLYEEWQSYMREASGKKKSIVNHYYNHPYDVFNRHSYQKAALVFHLLRNKLGDEAFFESFRYFLEQNKFNSAGIHHLRLAFEETTGKDLKRFFRTWFEEPGHPVISTRMIKDSTNNKYGLFVHQLQDTEIYPVYALPATFHVHMQDSIIEYQKNIHFTRDTFWTNSNTAPELIQFDPYYSIPAERNESKPFHQWYYQFYHTDHFRSRTDALNAISEVASEVHYDSLKQILNDALNEDYYGIRKHTLNTFRPLLQEKNKTDLSFITEKARELALNDPSAKVRTASVTLLSRLNDKGNIDIFEEALEDSSYKVTAMALNALYRIDSVRGLEVADRFIETSNDDLLLETGRIFAESGNEAYDTFFPESIAKMFIPGRYQMYYFYANYLSIQENPRIILESLDFWDSFLNRAHTKLHDREIEIGTACLERIKLHSNQTLRKKQSFRNELSEDSEQFERLTMEIYQFNQVIEQIGAIIARQN